MIMVQKPAHILSSPASHHRRMPSAPPHGPRAAHTDARAPFPLKARSIPTPTASPTRRSSSRRPEAEQVGQGVHQRLPGGCQCSGSSSRQVCRRHARQCSRPEGSEPCGHVVAVREVQPGTSERQTDQREECSKVLHRSYTLSTIRTLVPPRIRTSFFFLSSYLVHTW